MSSIHAEYLSKAIAAVKQKNPKNIYFVACGGSMAYMYNQQYIFDVETDIPAFILSSNEFIHRSPKGLGPDSLVVSCSHSGNTPETVEATKVARSKGALTVAYSHEENSPLWQAAEYNLHYDWGPESDAYEHKAGMALRFIFGALNALRPNEKYARALESIKDLNNIFERNKKKFAAEADKWGASHKREPIIYTMGSGPVYGEAYAFAICFLQEMLWVHSSSIHTGEYFHGPFEITDYDVPFLLFKTAGETRPLDERAENFAKKFSQKVTVLDAKDFDWTGIDKDLYSYLSTPIFGAVSRTYAERMAEHRGHPLTVRRYMWKMDY
ncbi:SIS domain-containing protein [Breznakiella homolactica]|uniref:SIS domain-containing protein n=1 Tax=Breznakiella homolactica TaxID=2798577 RepID=A0A7T7XJJ5_9SPIR|nr:SIS domain-containing protein [Breznakiella homolactica]QQO07387.1 SIS domain-containing protein [Breznakiella homolactica]